MGEMIGMIISAIASKNMCYEFKNFEMEVDTDMDLPLDEDMQLKMTLKGSMKVEYCKFEITDSKNQISYGLKTEEEA